jgi:hypothetical protein
MLEKSSLSEPLTDRRLPGCSPAGGIRIIDGRLFLLVNAPELDLKRPEQSLGFRHVGATTALGKRADNHSRFQFLPIATPHAVIYRFWSTIAP